MTPYQYAANNPVLFIDVNGDSIDTSGLTEEELKQYNEKIAKLLESDKFKKAYDQLTSSDAIYKIVMGSASTKKGGYRPNSLSKGSGGILTIMNSMDEYTIAHESFHAFQHDSRNISPMSTSQEVVALLFEGAVYSDLNNGMEMKYDGSGGPTFVRAMNNLQYGKQFSPVDFILATFSFLESGFNSGGDYKKLVPAPMKNPPINKFYPLMKF